VPCEEYQRLVGIYFAAIAKSTDAAIAMANFYDDDWPNAWRQEMRDIHRACEKALDDLDQHRRECREEASA
jgi:hypothetical protein